MRTWHLELAVAALFLAATVLLSGSAPREWLGALAVLAAFCHSQVADRLAEVEGSRERPVVYCWRRQRVYFVVKEVLWVVYFALSQTWAALAGAGLFLAYPLWQSCWRRLHPMDGP